MCQPWKILFMLKNLPLIFPHNKLQSSTNNLDATLEVRQPLLGNRLMQNLAPISRLRLRQLQQTQSHNMATALHKATAEQLAQRPWPVGQLVHCIGHVEGGCVLRQQLVGLQ